MVILRKLRIPIYLFGICKISLCSFFLKEPFVPLSSFHGYQLLGRNFSTFLPEGCVNNCLKPKAILVLGICFNNPFQKRSLFLLCAEYGNTHRLRAWEFHSIHIWERLRKQELCLELYQFIFVEGLYFFLGCLVSVFPFSWTIFEKAQSTIKAN